MSKNTNELKTRALGGFGLEGVYAWSAMEAKILSHEDADPIFDMVGGHHRWLVQRYQQATIVYLPSRIESSKLGFAGGSFVSRTTSEVGSR